MNTRRSLEFGGVAAGIVMVAFGVGSLILGIDARNTVGKELTREFIVGSPDMNPAETEKAVEEAGLSNVPIPSCDVAEKEIRTGADAHCFAQYMRIHALESSGGNTYSQMGRFVAAADPSDPKGTSDEAAAAKDESGEPIPNSARNTWVTETALSTALNVSYMAEQIGLFSIVVGIALILSGIGFVILAFAVLGGGARRTAA
jgi:ABC-type lipoprotein release transport system permease subunit